MCRLIDKVVKMSVGVFQMRVGSNDSDTYLRTVIAKGEVYAVLTYPENNLTVVIARKQIVKPESRVYYGHLTTAFYLPELIKEWASDPKSQLYTITGKGRLTYFGELNKHRVVYC